jgi:hypothetical protein
MALAARRGLGAASLWVLVHQRVQGLNLPHPARLGLVRGVCAPTRFSPACARHPALLGISRRQFKQAPCYPTASKALTNNHRHRVPICYNVSLSWHDLIVPWEPCASPPAPSNSFNICWPASTCLACHDLPRLPRASRGPGREHLWDCVGSEARCLSFAPIRADRRCNIGLPARGFSYERNHTSEASSYLPQLR